MLRKTEGTRCRPTRQNPAAQSGLKGQTGKEKVKIRFFLSFQLADRMKILRYKYEKSRSLRKDRR